MCSFLGPYFPRFGLKLFTLFRDENRCIFHPQKHRIPRMRQTQLGGVGARCKRPDWGPGAKPLEAMAI